jgi:hypothetical protein
MILPEYNPFYYKPLPKEITIRESDIEGLGIFATMNILEGKDLGKTHIKVPQFKGFIRTPIGGFINHADEPNCELENVHDWDDTQIYNIVTIKDIKKGDELTINYYE